MRRNVALENRMDQGAARGLIHVNHAGQRSFECVVRRKKRIVVVVRRAAAEVRGAMGLASTREIGIEPRAHGNQHD